MFAARQNEASPVILLIRKNQIHHWLAIRVHHLGQFGNRPRKPIFQLLPISSRERYQIEPVIMTNDEPGFVRVTIKPKIEIAKQRNTIARAGSLKAAVEQGVLTSGVMYEIIKHNVDFVLAGSIRDDGPLPDTIMDLRVAQDRYTESLQGVKLVLALSTMLHGIGVGNMLPSWVRMVCVDINPAVVTKLADRGSSQTIGIVTDVGLFLHRLAQKLKGPAEGK